MTSGILYVATGEEFVQEALLSAETAKNHMDLPITVITDQNINSQYIDRTIKIDDPHFGFGDQIKAMNRSPYDKTLCLDSDIYISEDPSDVFSLLESFDIAAAHAPQRSQMEGDQDLPDSFPEYNTGVIVYKQNDNLCDFLNEWKDEYTADLEKGFTRNQPAFRRALYDSNLRVATLPSEYNCRYQFPGQATYPVKIFHGRLTSLNSASGGAAHIMDIKKVAKKINSNPGPRVHYPKGNSVGIKRLSDRYMYRVLYSIKRNGLYNTAKAIAARISDL